jgi:protein-S-isoprenylcysteine O-methyltransferase Ste14
MSTARLYVTGQFALFAALALALIVFPAGTVPPVRLVGLALVALGVLVLALAVYAYWAINRTLPFVTPTPDAGAKLVESGIYARIRHPIYTAVLLGAFGLALAHGHLAPLFLALTLLAFFTSKSRYEEQMLRATYPGYAAYMERTGRFLPFL